MTAARVRTITEVAVGVLIRADGCVLLADRPRGKPYAGYWEFPGGKIEPGESVAAALARELHEELGVDIGAAQPWVSFDYDYPHAYVRLHFCRVTRWTGTPRGREGQRLDFFPAAGELPSPLLPAAVPALKWLLLPATYAISNVCDLGLAGFLRRLERALERGIRLIQLREPTFSDDAMAGLLHAVLPRARAAGAQVLVSSRHPRALWTVADGVHLTARDLLRLESRADLPQACRWVGASVHDRHELERAGRMGCDFAVVGPVLPTASHPGARPLGWAGFAERVRAAPLPAYAIGGLAAHDLGNAQQAGAHGIAMMRAAWQG